MARQKGHGHLIPNMFKMSYPPHNAFKRWQYSWRSEKIVHVSPVMHVHTWTLLEVKFKKLARVWKKYFLKVHRAESADSRRNAHMIQIQQYNKSVLNAFQDMALLTAGWPLRAIVRHLFKLNTGMWRTVQNKCRS